MTQATALAASPKILKTAFATSGTRTSGDIPATGTDVVNLEAGFPSIFSKPRSDSGKSVSRADMNSILYMLSSLNYFYQYMGVNPWVNPASTTGFDTTGYPKGAVVLYSGSVYVSNADNNVETPSASAVNWIKLWSEETGLNVAIDLSSIQSQIDNLSTTIASLDTRVTNLEQGGGSSWTQVEYLTQNGTKSVATYIDATSGYDICDFGAESISTGAPAPNTLSGYYGWYVVCSVSNIPTTYGTIGGSSLFKRTYTNARSENCVINIGVTQIHGYQTNSWGFYVSHTVNASKHYTGRLLYGISTDTKYVVGRSSGNAGGIGIHQFYIAQLYTDAQKWKTYDHLYADPGVYTGEFGYDQELPFTGGSKYGKLNIYELHYCTVDEDTKTTDKDITLLPYKNTTENKWAWRCNDTTYLSDTSGNAFSIS